MITQTIIKRLREDSTIQSLLDATGSSDCPVFVAHNFDDTKDKQINISLHYGATIPFDQSGRTSESEILIYVLIKDTLSKPTKKIHDITQRILELLDLKGSALNDTHTNTVYWVQKTDSDFTHYEKIHFYENALTFRVVTTSS
jgi:hypothetical protein